MTFIFVRNSFLNLVKSSAPGTESNLDSTLFIFRVMRIECCHCLKKLQFYKKASNFKYVSHTFCIFLSIFLCFF